jgi:hypothetical protein
MPRPDRLAYRVSGALAVVAVIVGAASFFFWGVFHRDAPMGVGNLRGTALTLLVIAVPLQLLSMASAARGSMKARFLWLGSLAYIAYNAVMFCFASHFNAYFLLYTTLLALSFWGLLSLIRSLDLEEIGAAASAVPSHTIAIYLLLSTGFFALAWLKGIVPAIVHDTMPSVIEDIGLTQNTVWVLDFSFTFPLMVLGALWLWRRRPCGYVLAGMMVVMLTIETLGVAIDQVFGHLHDPSASLAAVPVMGLFTAVGLLFSALFLRGMSNA